jgi:hypothetical protein
MFLAKKRLEAPIRAGKHESICGPADAGRTMQLVTASQLSGTGRSKACGESGTRSSQGTEERPMFPEGRNVDCTMERRSWEGRSPEARQRIAYMVPDSNSSRICSHLAMSTTNYLYGGSLFRLTEEIVPIVHHQSALG